MSTKTVRRVPAFFVIAVVGVAVMVLWPTLKASLVKEDNNVVVVTVSFDPAQRSGYPPPGRTMLDHVMFQITMGDVFFPKEFATRSPQVRTFIPQRRANTAKARIRVYAEQLYGKKLSCSITYPGLQDTMTKPGPTSVECILTVKAG